MIEKIEIATSNSSTCHRCRNPILKGEFRLVEKLYLAGHNNRRFYCMNCGGRIEVDILDKKRIEMQLNNDKLNLKCLTYFNS